MTQNIPSGFTPHTRKSAFTAPWEPLFSKREEAQARLGTYLREAHCNSRGLVHGGFVSAIADNAMGLSCALVLRGDGREVRSLVTISQSTDFLGMGKVGEWFETDSTVLKTSRSMGFVNCLLTADGRPVARSSATFKIG